MNPRAERPATDRLSHGRSDMTWVHFVGVGVLLYSALRGDTAGDILLYSALRGGTAGDIAHQMLFG